MYVVGGVSVGGNGRRAVYWPERRFIGQNQNILAEIEIYWPNQKYIGQSGKLVTLVFAFREIQLRGPNPPAVSPNRMRQKASHSHGLQHPADLNGPAPLFVRSSCDSQKLRYFTLSPEHKWRVLVQEFQYVRF